MMKISKKNYAAIMTAKDDMRAIVALGKNLTNANAYKTAYQMVAIAVKYMADFGNLDPAWTPSAVKKQTAILPQDE